MKEKLLKLKESGKEGLLRAENFILGIWVGIGILGGIIAGILGLGDILNGGLLRSNLYGVSGPSLLDYVLPFLWFISVFLASERLEQTHKKLEEIASKKARPESIPRPE